MPPMQSSSSPAFGRYMVKSIFLLAAFTCAVYFLGRPLYWRFFGEISTSRLRDDGSSCPPCICDCPLETASFLPQGLSNTTTDCGSNDPAMQEELNKHAVDLLTEELKLQSIVADENQQRSDNALLEVKKLSSQYQKEAEKCNFGMETCEEAREKAEQALLAQKKVTEMWKQRALELGWKGE